jgi:hypothetical protein
LAIASVMAGRGCTTKKVRAAPAAAPKTTNELLRIAYRFEDTSTPARQYSTGPDEIAAGVPDCSPIFDDRQRARSELPPRPRPPVHN